MSQVLVVVPTYNEAENVAQLIQGLRQWLSDVDYAILIIDDNSPDDTATVAEATDSERVTVHRRPNRQGIGAALQEGLRLALAHRDCESVVTMDGDLSHRPSDLPLLLDASRTADLVQGSRYVRGGRVIGWSLPRRVMSRTANVLCRVLTGSRTQENTTNFRVYSRRAAHAAAEASRQCGYEWVVETMLAVQSHGFRVSEVPITYVGRAAGHSKLRWPDILHWWSFLWKRRLGRHSRRHVVGPSRLQVR